MNKERSPPLQYSNTRCIFPGAYIKWVTFLSRDFLNVPMNPNFIWLCTYRIISSRVQTSAKILSQTHTFFVLNMVWFLIVDHITWCSQNIVVNKCWIVVCFKIKRKSATKRQWPTVQQIQWQQQTMSDYNRPQGPHINCSPCFLFLYLMDIKGISRGAGKF